MLQNTSLKNLFITALIRPVTGLDLLTDFVLPSIKLFNMVYVQVVFILFEKQLLIENSCRILALAIYVL